MTEARKPKPLPDQDTLMALLVYDPETGSLTWRARPAAMFGDVRSFHTWNTRYAGKAAFTFINALGYRCGHISQRQCGAHRVIWKMMTGADADIIDHIDGDPANNRWANLRSVSSTGNSRNSRRPDKNTSGTIGVSWRKNEKCWRAQIGNGNGGLWLGYFVNKADAIAARKEAEISLGYHPNHGRSGATP